jgi:predicted metal-dependent hydrolase
VARAERARLALQRGVKRLPRPIRRRLLRSQLAAIATIEHYTAVLGAWIVTADLPAGTDPQMLDLLRWHGAEEMEHRSVAFDLYQHVDGSYARRAVHGVIGSVGILLALTLIAARIMALDPDTDRNLRWRDYRRGVEAGHFPDLGAVVRSVREYLKRDYHPSGYGAAEEAAALAYLAISPGVAARAKPA